MDEKKIYDAHWREWEDMKIHGPMSRHVRRLVLNACSRFSFKTLLDVGCGPGIFLRQAAAKYPACSFFGVDISDTAIELAKKNIPAATLWAADVVSKPPEGTYDCITLVDVAEHIEEDQQAFTNLAKACSGYIVIATLEGRMREFEKNVGHVRNYKKNELCDKLKGSGFDIVLYKHWGWPIYSPLYRNLSAGIAADSKPMTGLRKFLGYVAYWILGCGVPGIGDIIIVVGKIKPRAEV